MKLNYVISIAFVALLNCRPAMSQAAPAAEAKQANACADLLAKIEWDRQIALELAPVKSLSDFRSHQADGSRGMAAFSKLSSASQRDFLASLRFSEKGLVGFNFQILEDELSVEEAYSLLSMFGLQHTVRVIGGLRATSALDQLIRQSVRRPRCEDDLEAAPNVGGGK